jgi:hypothetical protein
MFRLHTRIVAGRPALHQLSKHCSILRERAGYLLIQTTKLYCFRYVCGISSLHFPKYPLLGLTLWGDLEHVLAPLRSRIPRGGVKAFSFIRETGQVRAQGNGCC